MNAHTFLVHVYPTKTLRYINMEDYFNVYYQLFFLVTPTSPWRGHLLTPWGNPDHLGGTLEL